MATGFLAAPPTRQERCSPGPSAWVSPHPHHVLKAPSLPPDLCCDGADHHIKLQLCHMLLIAPPGFIFSQALNNQQVFHVLLIYF